LYVLARIIKVLMDKGEMNKTKLSTFSNLSYDKFMIYLKWMIERDLIEENNNVIKLKKKGIETYHELVEWVFKYVGKIKF
ncbi:MAG: winged helix-turn-helix domain-containing protein, partial [Thermoplasmata archaeon]